MIFISAQLSKTEKNSSCTKTSIVCTDQTNHNGDNIEKENVPDKHLPESYSIKRTEIDILESDKSKENVGRSAISSFQKEVLINNTKLVSL